MAEIHHLIRSQGVDAARKLVSADDKKFIDLAAAVLDAETPGLSLCYSGFALTSLPHRALAPGERWERHGHNLSLIITPGSLRDTAAGVTKVLTVPYGAMARMILLYLQTQALQTGNPEIRLGNSMRDWLGRMGVQAGGKTIKSVREQARLISMCQLSFQFQGPNGIQRVCNDAIVRSAILVPYAGEQPTLWEDTVRLSDTFYAALKAHPVPLAEPAIREISNDSSAIDCYIWLAYRLHSLEKATPVTWSALHGQFGGGYKLVRQFKPKFVGTLKKALAVYPDARVDVEDEGVVLWPSEPPVTRKALLG